MIFVLYGSDTYSSRKELNNLIARFREKNGLTLIVERFDAEEDPLDDMKKIAGAVSLFQEQRLIVVERIFSKSVGPFEVVRAHLAEWSGMKDTHFIFWESAVPKTASENLKELLKQDGMPFLILSPNKFHFLVLLLEMNGLRLIFFLISGLGYAWSHCLIFHPFRSGTLQSLRIRFKHKIQSER